MKTLILFLCIVSFCFAQNVNVQKAGTGTNAITADLSFLTGRTLTIGAGGTFDSTAGTTRINTITSANLTITGNITVSGIGISTFAGPITVSGNTTAGSGMIQTVNLASASFINGIVQLAPNLTAGQATSFVSGVAITSYNALDLRFVYSSSGSQSNRMDFGFAGVATPKVSITGNGNLLVGTTTDITGSGGLDVTGTNITFAGITPAAGLVAVGHKFPVTFADGVHNVLTD